MDRSPSVGLQRWRARWAGAFAIRDFLRTFVFRYRTVLDIAHVFAGILAAVVLAVIFDRLVQIAERRMTGGQVRAGSAPEAVLHPVN